MSIRFLLGLTIGLVIGASVGLAIAPRAGKETRGQLLQNVRSGTA